MEIDASRRKELIDKYMHFYCELDNGHRQPTTEAQKHFVSVCRGRAKAQTEHEIVYSEFKKVAKNTRTFPISFKRDRPDYLLDGEPG